MPNDFVWHELMTTDADSASAFYRDVVGWRTQPSGMPGMNYTIVSVGEIGVGGIASMPPEVCSAGARPGWIGYVGVDDVDAYAKRVEGAGGAIHKAENLPGVGRFVVVADPQGARFILFTAASQQPPARPTPDALGMPGLERVHAGEWQSAFAFIPICSAGPKPSRRHGPAGTYGLFAAGGSPSAE